jgi:hypothetical protein
LSDAEVLRREFRLAWLDSTVESSQDLVPWPWLWICKRLMT